MHAAAPGNNSKIDAEHMNCSSSTDAYLYTAHLTKKTTTLQNKRTMYKKTHINRHSKGNHTCMMDFSNAYTEQ